MSAVFAHGRLRLYLLMLLAEAPMHGYELMRRLEDDLAGRYAPSAGTIYPRLARLEAEGLVSHVEAGGRKTYAITAAGRAELAAKAAEVAALPARIDAVLAQLDGTVTGRRTAGARVPGSGAPAARRRPPPDGSGNADLQRQLDAFSDAARGLIARAKPDAARAKAVSAALDSTLRTLRDLLR